MSLAKYKEKRSFDKTPEPTGGKPKDSKLHFVVQKHHASHLHYDFRLEMEGVLKSWAVPKGPSMNPLDKRLAMMVEDHPWDYHNFEGIIPSGYGAGTVIVWDEGTYEPVEKKKTKKENEKSLMHHLYQGAISIVLKGKKLKGEFALVKTNGRGENAWLLIKKDDQFASTEEISKKDKSVLSHKTLEQVQAHPAKEWKSNRANNTPSVPDLPSSENEESQNIDFDLLLKKRKKSTQPSGISPMLCSLIKEPFQDPEYLYEVKFDGYRITASVKKGKVTLNSRSGIDYTHKYPAVANELKKLDFDVVLDGEIVALNKEGHPDFDALQKNTGENPLAFYIFDIIWGKGYDLMNLPLIERKDILSQLVPFNEVLKYSDHFDDGIQLFDLIKTQQMEGIVAKKRQSLYQPGKRNKDWLKLPTERRQEFVIGGWTESESGTPFAALVFGYYEKGKLIYQGHAGGGYTNKQKKEIFEKIKKLEIPEKPFANKVDTARKVHWMRPELVANIKFATYTSSGNIRKPAIFLSFRDDKKPEKVIEEKIVERDVTDDTTKNLPGNKYADDSNWRVVKKEKVTSKETFDIGGKQVLITNVEKELWKGITKAKLIEYYHAIAPTILPYLKDRPESLHIKNLKATAPGLYIKDMEGQQPSWVEIFTTPRKHKKKGKNDKIDYLVCQDEATLLYMVNLGCIDINPWTSRISNYQQPDFIIIDLDPSDEDFSKVTKTALAAKRIFHKLKIKAFPKTSGKTGMHFYIPCENFSFPEARSIAENICRQINQLVPDITTTEVSISKRGARLYIDPNQNDEADTVAAAYCVRPSRQPTVSTPLEWKEINDKLDPKKFDMHSILDRIKKKGDLFEGVMDEKIRLNNTKMLKKIL
jgi:bifunctional non-homologous end joining protein LigD